MTNLLPLDSTTWSFKSYLLIASTKPFFAFFYPGYARSVRFDLVNPEETREGFKAVLGEREVSMEEIQFFVSHEGIAGAKFVQTHVETFQRRVSELVIRAARSRVPHVPKAHQLFELDFLLDDQLRMWYLHANAAPNFPSSLPLNQKMQEDMRPLLLELADTPQAFAGMRPGDYYGSFRLVVSDYSDITMGSSRALTRHQRYDACAEFKKKWSIGRAGAKLTNELHDVSTRHRRANERELKKFISAKWAGCRAKGRAPATCGQGLRAFIKWVCRVSEKEGGEYLELSVFASPHRRCRLRS